MNKYDYLNAARNGNIKLMEKLESKDNFVRNHDKINSYITAVCNGNIKIMNYFESKGYNINMITLKLYGYNVYYIANKIDILKTKKYLINKKQYKINKYNYIYL